MKTEELSIGEVIYIPFRVNKIRGDNVEFANGVTDFYIKYKDALLFKRKFKKGDIVKVVVCRASNPTGLAIGRTYTVSEDEMNGEVSISTYGSDLGKYSFLNFELVTPCDNVWIQEEDEEFVVHQGYEQIAFFSKKHKDAKKNAYEFKEKINQENQ